MTDLTDDLDLIRRLRREYPPWTLVPVKPAKPAKPRVLRPCGTMAAVSRHRRAGEPLCDLCRAAFNEYQRLRRRRLILADAPGGPA